MKKKDFNLLKEKSLGELEEMVASRKEESEKVKLNISSGKEKNLKKAALLRKEVAKILTLIRENENI